MNYQNIKRAKAIEQKNKERLLKLNPELNDKSGIYFFLRSDEYNFRFAYIGQAKNITQRCCSHLVGYQQHIDLSIRKHGLYSGENPHGWRLEFLNFPESELDEKEKYYIKKYADAGYQLRNVSVGGQGSERGNHIGEAKAAKGYRDGVLQGKKSLAKELNHIAEKHLKISIKPEKANNKVSIKQYEKFMELIGANEEMEE